MKKKFIITIDTEGDNLWDYRGGEIGVRNAEYLPRFQALCDEFNFKPVYLTNYEMAKSKNFIAFAKKTQEEGRCEIGLHLHAWNSPPLYELPKQENGLAYLIEYPDDIMKAKLDYLHRLLCDTFGETPISHRAGRWAMNQKYFDLLIELGYKVDCSVTPKISWKKSMGQTKNSFGSDYKKYPSSPYFVNSSHIQEKRIWEAPVTVEIGHYFLHEKIHSPKKMAGEALRFLRGRPIWIRPNGNNLGEMLFLAKKIAVGDAPYLMFMIHSSELMPGGSPTFKTEESIEKLYLDLRILFAKIANDFEGSTFKEYYKETYGE